jgi:hypothetical protein
MMTLKSLTRFGTLLLASIALISCGPNKKAQCESVLETVQATENQLEVGTLTKALLMSHADLYDELSRELTTLDIKNKKISQTVMDLAAGYGEYAAAQRAQAEVTNAEGIIRGKDTYKKIRAQEIRANNQIQLHTEQLFTACR